jgi:hypothetical protein
MKFEDIFPYKIWQKRVAFTYEELSSMTFIMTEELIRKYYNIPKSLKYCHEDYREGMKVYTFFGWEK